MALYIVVLNAAKADRQWTQAALRLLIRHARAVVLDTESSFLRLMRTDLTRTQGDEKNVGQEFLAARE